MEGQYFHSHVLPIAERLAQSTDHIKAYWQPDAYLQADLTKWLPWRDSCHGLCGQLRVNNLFAFDPKKYTAEETGIGVVSDGHWRGRVYYSVSVTATF